MKIRNGFVSNSSSSSFIIAYKEGERCPHCGRTDLNLVDVMKNSGNDGETYVSSTNWMQILEDNSWRDEEDILEIKKSIEECLSKNMSIAEIEISHHNDGLLGVLKSQVNNGSIKLIKGRI